MNKIQLGDWRWNIIADPLVKSWFVYKDLFVVETFIDTLRVYSDNQDIEPACGTYKTLFSKYTNFIEVLDKLCKEVKDRENDIDK